MGQHKHVPNWLVNLLGVASVCLYIYFCYDVCTADPRRDIFSPALVAYQTNVPDLSMMLWLISVASGLMAGGWMLFKSFVYGRIAAIMTLAMVIATMLMTWATPTEEIHDGFAATLLFLGCIALQVSIWAICRHNTRGVSDRRSVWD